LAEEHATQFSLGHGRGVVLWEWRTSSQYNASIRRRLLNLLSALSLLLCISLIACWSPSYERAFKVEWSKKDAAGRRYTSVGTSITCGGLDILVAHFPAFDGGEGLWWGRAPARLWGESHLWFIAGRDDDGESTRRWVVVPHWVLVGLTALLPAVRTARWLRQRRKLRDQTFGLCPACGYDLTANVSGVCPECGCRGVTAPDR
jgi:hypothetical protein